MNIKLKRLSDKKLGIDYSVPIYYKRGDFISEEIGCSKLNLRWKIKDGDIKALGFKRRFWQNLSREYSFKMKNIEELTHYDSFKLGDDVYNLSVVKCFYFKISKQQMRDYKIKNLIK